MKFSNLGMNEKTTLIFMPIRSLDDVPTFTSDEEARHYWNSHFLDLEARATLPAAPPIFDFEFEDFELYEE